MSRYWFPQWIDTSTAECQTERRRLIAIAAVCAFVFAANCRMLFPQDDPNTLKLLAQNGAPTVTFSGQVVALQTSVGSRQNAIVKVTSIVDAPPYFTRFVGHDITVNLRQPNAVEKGSEVVFYATGLTVGKEMSVAELFHSGASNGNARQILSKLQHLANREELRSEAAQTTLIVSGKVIATRAVESAASPGEHDGGRMIATIQIEAVIKPQVGAPVLRNQRISVVFPDPKDRDVSVVAAPRFSTGQKGIWLLRKLSGSDKYGLGPTANSSTLFKAPGSADFQDMSKLGLIQSVVQ